MTKAWRQGGTLVVLGASAHTAGTYQRAAKLGYRTVAVDRRPCVELADEYLAISCRAPEQIAAALADRPDIVGVLCAGTDAGIAARAELTRHWRLADRLPESAVRPSTDKTEFRRLCERLGLPGYGWVSGRPGPDLLARARRLRFPAVVKPVDGSGARGVAPCASPAALPRAVTEALTHSPGNRVRVEEFVAGRHLTVEALVRDGAVAFHAVSERTLTPPPFFGTASHLLPAAVPGEVDAELVRVLTAVCAAIGYRSGPLTLAAVLGHDATVYPVDVSVRTGENGLPEAIESAYGVDVTAAAIALATGEDVRLAPRPPRPTLVHLLSADRPGTLTDVEGAAEVRAMPEVVDLQLFVTPGARVEPYEPAGQVVLSGGPATALYAASSAVRSALRFRLAEQDFPVPRP